MSAAERSTTRGRVVAPMAAPQPTRVRGVWLLGALGLLLLAALCCAYLSLCLLFAQGQWQLLYRPTHTITTTPSSLGVVFSQVRFGPTEAGVNELSGWWLPAAPSSPLAATTVLYLHGGAGSLGDAVPDLAHLHALGCAVFAIDYRGFGASAGPNPSEARMVDDAAQAILYLTETRHVAAASLVVWGRGTGATVAAQAAASASAPQTLRLVLQEANLPALTLLRADGRTRLLPVRLLLRDRLDAASLLATSSTQKLFLGSDAGTTRLYTLAAAPRQMSSGSDDAKVKTFLAAGTVRRQGLQP